MALSTLPRLTPDLVGVRFLQYNDRTDTVELPSAGVAELSDADLADLEKRAVGAFEKIRDKAELSDADVEEAERLAEVVTAVRTESGQRTERVEGRKTKLASLGENIDGGADTDEAPAAEAVEELPAAEAVEELPELVAASAAPAAQPTRVRAADLSGRTTRPAAPKRAPISLVAAPDAPGKSLGSTFANVDEVAEAVLRRTSEYPSQPMAGTRTVMRHGIALLRKEFSADLVAATIKDDEVLFHAADQSRLPGGSLIAAGGWAAPSETLYDLAEIEAADGLVDLPEIQVKRGGIRFTPGPDFRSIYNGSGFQQTEAQAISGTTKPMYNVPVPNFTEVRADATGVGITAGILQNSAYPELTARVIRGAMAAHAHKVSASSISYMVAGSTAVAANGLGGGAAGPILATIELAVEDIKYLHRMARTAVLEAVFPAWTFAVIRADLAFRLGVSDFMSVTDEQIMQWFTARRIKPQFVYDWQDTALGQSTPVDKWPNNLQFMIYPAGTWVRGHGEVISLDTVYDSASLAQNQYTALFTEESLLVAKLGFESRLYTVPFLANGFVQAGGNVLWPTT